MAAPMMSFEECSCCCCTNDVEMCSMAQMDSCSPVMSECNVTLMLPLVVAPIHQFNLQLDFSNEYDFVAASHDIEDEPESFVKLTITKPPEYHPPYNPPLLI